MATKLLGQMLTKLFGVKHLINESVRYFFWSRGDRKMLKHYERRQSRKFGNRWPTQLIEERSTPWEQTIGNKSI